MKRKIKRFQSLEDISDEIIEKENGLTYSQIQREYYKLRDKTKLCEECLDRIHKAILEKNKADVSEAISDMNRYLDSMTVRGMRMNVLSKSILG